MATDRASALRHSGFAQFPDLEKREEFVRAVLAGDAALTDRAYLSGSRPTIVFENLTAAQQRHVESSLQGLGRWFEDIRFQPTGPT